MLLWLWLVMNARSNVLFVIHDPSLFLSLSFAGCLACFLSFFFLLSFGLRPSCARHLYVPLSMYSKNDKRLREKRRRLTATVSSSNCFQCSSLHHVDRFLCGGNVFAFAAPETEEGQEKQEQEGDDHDHFGARPLPFL